MISSDEVMSLWILDSLSLQNSKSITKIHPGHTRECVLSPKVFA